MKWSHVGVGVLMVIPAWSEQAQAQAGVSLQIDPSVRSVGMAHATSSVFWGDEPNYWANPALLGYHSGLHYEWQEVQLVPQLADDVFFKSNRFTLGAWGIGVALSGKPFRLEYGASEATDSQGNPLGSFDSFEEIQSWGVGVNLVEFGESVLRGLHQGNPQLGRYVDASLGFASKDLEVDFLSGAPPGVGGGAASTTAEDFGVQVRVTPLNSIDYPVPEFLVDHVPSFAELLDQVGGLRVDLTMARSWLNYNDAQLDFGTGSDPINQDNRRGMGFRIVSGAPKDKRSVLDGGSWLAALFTPVVSFGMAWDRSATATSRGERLEHYAGWEATILNVFSIRGGRTDIPQVDVVDINSGWGLGLRLGDVLGVRWDEARRPQAEGLGNTKHRGLSAFVNIVALGQYGLGR